MEENGMIEMDFRIGEYYKVTDKVTRKVYKGKLLYYTPEGICIGYNNISHFLDFESYEIKEVKNKI